MKFHWRDLRSRDRFSLVAGGVVLLLLIGFMASAPFLREISGLRSEVFAKRSELAWMHEKSGEAARLKVSIQQHRSDGVQEAPLTMLEKTAALHNLGSQLKRVEPGDLNQVKVWLEKAAYTDIVGWLYLLDERGFRPVALSADRVDEPGMVNARLTVTVPQ